MCNFNENTMTTTRCLINSLITMLFCIYGGAGISASVKDSLSYENYCKMLERETRVPVSEIPNDEGMKYLQERIKAMKVRERQAGVCRDGGATSGTYQAGVL